MRKLAFLPLFLSLSLLAQDDMYFPPTGGNEWETISPEELGWCTDEIDTLMNFLEDRNTNAFIVLYKGRMVFEEYFGDFVQDSIWVWNSAGKTVTAWNAGIAAQEGLLDLDAPTSEYLGEGWTSCTPEQEAAITVRHQLTMTTGLSDLVEDIYCTDPECLEFLEPAGDRWAYHNGPYTLLDDVISEATGQNYNLFTFGNLQSIGMSGFFFPFGYNNVYVSKARDMARFGILMQNGGNWDGDQLMTDTEYFNNLITPSQDLNHSYGYLWWLNGQDNFMMPGSQLVFPGPLMPTAPSDLFAAIGKDAQILHVVNSEDLVVVRMGLNPDEDAVPVTFNIELWELLSNIIYCETLVEDATAEKLLLSPNPADQILRIQGRSSTESWSLFDLSGRVVFEGKGLNISTGELAEGSYILRFSDGSSTQFMVRH